MAVGFTGLLGVGAVASAFLVGVAWHRREEPGAKPLVVLNVALAVGAAAYAVDIVSTTLSTQRPFAKVWLVAQAGVAITWLFVALEYAGYRSRRTRRVAALLAVEPVVLAGILATPWTDRWVVAWPESGTAGSIVQSGGAVGTPLFFAHSLVILVVSLAGSLVLVRLFVRSRHLYRTQAGAVLVAALAPWVVVLTQTLLVDFPEDPTIFAWIVSGGALTAGLYRFKPLDTVPAAHEAIVETMGDGALVVDEDGRVSDANPRARTLLDVTDPVGRRIEDLLPDWDSVEKRAGGWQELTLDVDGEWRFLEAELTPFTDRFDRVVGHLFILRDVTERERRSRRLARYKTIFESVTQPVYVLDDGAFVTVNEPFCRFVGYEEEDLLGKPFEWVLVSESPTDSASAGGEVTIERQTGESVPCETDMADIPGEDGRVVGVIRDISRRKAIESELAETTERFETLVESSPLAIVATDTEGRVEVWNPAAEELFGWAATDVLGEEIPVIPDADRERILDQHERVLAGERLTGLENVLERKDGSTVEVSVSIAPVQDAAGEVTGSVSVIADITERKRRERELERTNERLEEFASIVSHDLRNPLGVASGNLELAAMAEDGDSADAIESAQDALERMERIIEDTLTLAREGKDIEQLEAVDFEATIRQAWGNTVTGDATLEVGDVPATIESDESRLRTLLENLFANAIEHGARDRPTGELTVRVGGRAAGFFVADDGRGIPADAREAVFDSGYSTADTGTGFGLSIVQTVAQAHGWTVTIADSEDGGARFDFGGVTVLDGSEND